MSTNPFNLSKIKHIIAISSCKGGVGKSTMAAALARALSIEGHKTGLLDADIYGPSLPVLFNLQEKRVGLDEFKMIAPVIDQNLKLMSFGFLLGDAPAVMRGPIVTRYLQQLLFQTNWGDLDFLIIDMPPGTGDVALTITQSVKLTGAVIVTTPHGLSLVDTARGILMFEKVKVPILGIIENMAYFKAPDTGKKYYIFGYEKTGALTSRFGVKTLVEIPIAEEFAGNLEALADNLFIKEAVDGLLNAVELAEKNQEILKSANFCDPDIVLVMNDGRTLTAKAWDLRVNCPCALCVSEINGQRLLDPGKIPLDIKPQEILPLGNYALSITWSDGHASGIYPYGMFK